MARRNATYQSTILGLVGFGALCVVTSSARSADFALPAPVADPSGEMRAFISGGAFWTGGEPIPYGSGSGGLFGDFAFLIDPTVAPNVGWNAGTGFDDRFAASPWHINGQFRYGQSRGSGSGTPEAFSANELDSGGNPETISGGGSTSASLREKHWLVDFGAGYEFPFGRNTFQVNFGIRTAQLTATTNSPTTFNEALSDPLAAPGDPTSISANESSSTVQKSTFLGAGPRVGVEGSVPFGHFSFDYAANAAYLIGTARINSETTTSFSINSLPVGTGLTLSESGITSGSTYGQGVAIINTDFLVGVSYWFNPAFKIMVDYRLDAYLAPLRSFDINGNVVSFDRYYHGPEITLAAKF
jgi:Legionella pneumophila major outer membrane protein precursor